MFSIKSKAIVCGFMISILVSAVNFSNKCEGIGEKVFRLHIVANSDSEQDQALKLRVRDRILNDFSSNFDSAENKISAKVATTENLKKIEECARTEIKNSGFDYSVSASVNRMYFNTRKYGNTTLPAGYYDALRVSIGEAAGKNWWCVMFPPMCVPAAIQKIDLSEVLTQDEFGITQNETRYRAAFKTLEVFMDVRNCLEKFFCQDVFELSYEHLEYQIGFKTFDIFSGTENETSDTNDFSIDF